MDDDVVSTAVGRGSARDGRDARWEQHREQRREALVDATIRAIRRHGAGVGMDDIAAEAGTSKTVIYRHFDDKAGLYRAVAARIDGRVVRNIGAALARRDRRDRTGGREGAQGPGGSGGSDAPAPGPRELVASTVEAYLSLVESDTEVYRFVVTRPLVDRPLPDDPVDETVVQVADQLTRLLLESLTGPGTEPSRARTWAVALVGAVRAVADDWLATPEADRAPRAAVVESLTELAWHGLAPALAAPTPNRPTTRTTS